MPVPGAYATRRAYRILIAFDDTLVREPVAAQHERFCTRRREPSGVLVRGRCRRHIIKKSRTRSGRV